MKKAKFFDNIGLKVLAVFISILLWLVVLNVSDPVRVNTYNDIPIRVVNADAITNQGKVYELRETTDVAITVSAKRSILDSLDRDNFSAVVDLSRVNMDTGSVNVKVESNKYSESIESMKSKTETVSVSIEDMMRKQFFITPIVTGEPENGYVIGDVTTAENIVRISGAESVVSSIKKVTAEVSVSGLSRSINTSVDLKLYDENGEPIKDFNLTKNISTVAVSAQILETKKAGVVANTYIGEPAEGYGIVGDVTADRDTVIIAGKSANLSAVNVVEIPATAVNVDGLTETTTFDVDVSRYLPEGIVLADAEADKIVKVTVPIESMKSRTIELPVNLIKIENVPEGFEAAFTNEVFLLSVDFVGSAAEIDALSVTEMLACVDVGEYLEKQGVEKPRAGTFRLPVMITCAGTQTVSMQREYNLNLNLTEIEE